MNSSKIILITGGNTGIGLATAKLLAQQGHRLILACRDLEKAERARREISGAAPKAEVFLYALDLANLDSVRACAAAVMNDFPQLDVLINNAGLVPTKQQFTHEGFEMQFGVNYLGPFLLTHLLLPALEKAPEARIVNLSSIMHHFGKIDFDSFRGKPKYSSIGAYGQSKLGNLMFSNELSRRLPAHVLSNAVHPGGVDSDIYRELPKPVHAVLRLFLITTERAGRYIANMAVGNEWAGRTGEFKSAHGPLPVAARSRDRSISEKLYAESCRLTGITGL